MSAPYAYQGSTTHQRTPSAGFTLPELLISLAVTSLMTLTAVNHLPTFIQTNRMAGEVNRFVTVLQHARNEAVKQGRHIVLCPGTEDRVCAERADWGNGWLLFASDNNREREPDEPLVFLGEPLTDFIAMRSGGHRKRIVYQPDGSSGGTNTSFTFCDRRKLAEPRVICLSNAGRPRLTTTRCDGKPIECP